MCVSVSFLCELQLHKTDSLYLHHTMAFCCCGAGVTASVTSKNADQVRHLEAMGISRGPSPRLQRTEVQIPVTLNVYSLLENNKKLSKLGMGVYHTGVVVYGIEWGYGEVVENPNASGLFCVHPGQAAGTLHRTIRIGYTTRSPMQVDTILHRLENEWRSREYHILHHNCNHFAQAFCDLLSTTEKLRVPAWCNRAARIGDRLIPRKLATKVQHMMDAEPPKAVDPAPFCNVNEVPLSVVPREWYLHPSIFQPMRYVSDSRPESLQSRDNVPAAATTHSGSGGGGGGSHYTLEYDILPPPGYETAAADPGSPYPPLMHRETFLATDENGSISHITAIEEQRPSATRTSRVESTRKSTRSHRAAKPTPGHSPVPSSLGRAASTGAQDRVAVLSRVQTSMSCPQSVVPVGSSPASVLGTDTESLQLRSDGSNDYPPHNVPRPELVPSQRLSATTVGDAADANPLADEAGLRRTMADYHTEREDAAAERSLFTMRETSLLSTTLGTSVNSYGSGHGKQKRSSLGHARQAQPVGCINAFPLSLSLATWAADEEEAQTGTPKRKEKKQPCKAADDDRQATAPATDTASEASLMNASAVSDAKKNKRESESKAPRGREKASSPHHGRIKHAKDFSDLVAAVPAVSPHDSPNGSIAGTDSKKKSSAWTFLLKARGMGAPSESSRKAKKYLSTSPQSDAASRMDGDRSQNLDTVSETSSLQASQTNLAVQPARGQDAELCDHSYTATTTATALRPAAPLSLASVHSVSAMSSHQDSALVVPSIARGGGDVAPTLTDASSPPPPPPPSQQENSGTPAEGRCSRTSNPASVPESSLLQQPRCLLEDALLPISASAGELQSLCVVSTPETAEPGDSPGRPSQAFTMTPERAVVSTLSAAATTGTSPATAHHQTRRGSISTLSDTSTPPPQVERSRTPIPHSRRQLDRDAEHASSSLLLELGGDAADLPTPRSLNSSHLLINVAPRRSSSFRASAGLRTPLSPDKVAHTPMAPCPRRPSLLSRERPSVASAKKSQPTPDPDKSALAAQPNLAVELKEAPPKSQTPAGNDSTLDGA